ncbi:helix-turn-helix domain-containing protein [Sutcliffiella halmapala]|uniref:helix-turn-helix domain-containing protein n=1 Tax=Sutcliffiella halmapala TaxID=79882 RepID=UPI000994EA08|nr:RodZ domain-containing protein [Sutcliffiella halmapala]
MTELGNKLKQEREAKNLSLEDLQTITKIQKRYLIGVEEGNYSIMPGQFYARAFIKQYAEAVGLDPEEIFEEYKNDIPVNEKEEIPQLSRVKTRKQIQPKDTKVLNFLPKLLLILGFIALCVLIYGLVLYFSNKDNPDQNQSPQGDTITEIDAPNQTSDSDTGENATDEDAATEEDEEPDEETPTTGTITEVARTGANTTLELSDTDKFIVELTSSGETWIGISNTKGHNFFSDSIKEGQTETIDLSQEEEIVFNVGRSYETDIKINEVPFEFPSEATVQKITIKFLPNGEQ